jgi:hypothetical protein
MYVPGSPGFNQHDFATSCGVNYFVAIGLINGPDAAQK